MVLHCLKEEIIVHKFWKRKNENLTLILLNFKDVVPCGTVLSVCRRTPQKAQNICFPLDVLFEKEKKILYL